MANSPSSEWFVTDDDCLQCCRPLPAANPQVFDLVQINSFAGHIDGAPFYQVAKALIDVSEYTEDEILDALGTYGYKDMDDFVLQNSPNEEFIYHEDGTLDRENSPGYIIEYQLIAEMLFELEAQEYVQEEFRSWNDAVNCVSEITGMDLSNYHEEPERPSLSEDSLLFGIRNENGRAHVFITTPEEMGNVLLLDPEELAQKALYLKNTFGHGVAAFEDKYSFQIAESISQKPKLAADYLSWCVRQARGKPFHEEFEIPSAQTCAKMSELLAPIFAAGLSDAERSHNVLAAIDYAKDNDAYIQNLHDVFTAFHLMDVSRDRISVTQGTAVVHCAGKDVVRYGDDMFLQQKDGTFTSGFRNILEGQHHGPVIGGWGSLKPDESFIKASFSQYPSRIFRCLLDPDFSKEKHPSLSAQIQSADAKKSPAVSQKQQADMER